MSRRQAAELISNYEAQQPPLEMLRLEAERKEAARLLALSGRKREYPGVTPLMLRSVSAGVLKFGGVDANGSRGLPPEPRLLSTAGPSSRRGKQVRMQFDMNSVRPMTGTSPIGDFANHFTMGSRGRSRSVEEEKKEQKGSEAAATTKQIMMDGPSLAEADGASSTALVHKLTSQCNNLAWRLVALEQELESYKQERQEQMNNPVPNLLETLARPTSQSLRSVATSSRSRTPSPSRSRRRSNRVADDDVQEEKRPPNPKLLPIEKSTQNLTNLVTSLTKSLYGDDKAKSEAKEMTDALKAHEREKKRYEEYLVARREWKRLHTVDLVLVLKMEVQRQRIMAEKIEAFRHMLANKKRQVFLREWHGVMLENLEERKRLIAASLDMENRHFNSVMRHILKLWFDVAHGPYSRKGVMERHRVRMANERIKLEKKLRERGEDIGLITKEMLIDEMRKTVVEQLAKQRQFHGMKKVVLALKYAVQIAEENSRESVMHYKCVSMRKIFMPWSKWAWLNSQGLDRARWKAPGKLQVSTAATFEI